MTYVPRLQAARLRRLLRIFPAVLVLGPRQSGKTTFVRHELRRWKYIDLEDAEDFRLLSSDIGGFLRRHSRRLVVDEAQRLPDLFTALRPEIDRERKPGRFVLTGSANPALLRSISESLAGRIGILELTPFLAVELEGQRASGDRWFYGGFPAVHAVRGPQPRGEWLEAQIATFLERDLPTLGFRLPARRLRIFWTMLTHVHGNLVNLSNLADSLTVSYHTVSDYLDLFEGAFMIRRLYPYFASVGKRLVKSPKLYIRDTGILHHLAGLRQPSELETWHYRAASFEGLVIEEIVSQVSAREIGPEFYFWRTQAGAEVDLLVKVGRKILPIEVKLGAAPDARSLAGLRQCMADLGLKRGWVVCNARERRDYGRGIEIVPWAEIAAGKEKFAL